MTLLSGFEASLFVSEPALVNPMHWTWDHKGRLWVVESTDYPDIIRENSPVTGGGDRVIILEDFDGDGQADARTIFAEGLNIPVGIALTETGIIVNVTGSIWHLEDLDGDGQADTRTELYSGYPIVDTHLQENSVQYGLDNRYWVSQGGWSGTQGHADLDHGAFVFKLGDPSTEHVVYETSDAQNRWGIAFTEEGDAFMNGANSAPVWNYPIPYTNYLEASLGYRTASMGNFGTTATAPGIGIWNSGFKTSGSQTNMSTAMGISIYTARLFPTDYHNKAVFLPNPGGRAVSRNYFTPDKSTFVPNLTHESLVYSSDPWFTPLRAEAGPDGAVWIMDWCDINMGHFESRHGGHGLGLPGQAGAHDRDKQHGRIYRITPTNPRTVDPIPKLDENDISQLVRTLRHDNRFWRLTAQRLLVYKTNQKQEVVDAILPTLTYSNREGETENWGTIHALWTLHGLDAIDANVDAIYPLLRHPSDAVVRHAMKVLPKNQATVDSIAAVRVLEDSNPHLRLNALVALADMPASVSGTLPMRSTDQALDAFATDAVAMANRKVTVGTASNGGDRVFDLALDPAPPVDFGGSTSLLSGEALSGVAPVLYTQSGTITGAAFRSADRGVVSFYSLNGALLGTRTLENQSFVEGPFSLNSNLSFYRLQGSSSQITGKILKAN
jgi:putative membrane-bound dehydrogenase-like protein